MKDEIKEIIEALKPHKDIKEYPLSLTLIEQKILLDHIINLQEENEKLKETNVYCNRTDCSERIKDSRKYDSVYQEKEDYKSRNEKAIEYIKNNLSLGVDTFGSVYSIGANKVLNILNGGDDND